MRRAVEGIGTQGIFYDLPPHLLPSPAWSGGRNVRFKDGKVISTRGVQPVFESEVSELLWAGFVLGPTGRYYLFGTNEAVFSYDGTTIHDITKDTHTYNIIDTTLWDLELYNGLAILNNGVEVPQLWAPSTGSELLIDLPNWDNTHRALTIRGFKGFLIALNVTKGSTLLPHEVWWSAPAEPGAVPSTWDVADPTELAGRFALSDTGNGEIVNGLPLGDIFYIYKESAIWALRYTQGADVFRADPLADGVGLKVRRSLVNLPSTTRGRKYQFFADEDMFYIMDGVKPEPIFEEKIRSEIGKLRDDGNYGKSFSVVNPIDDELWFCFPEAGSSTCTLAAMWNYKLNTFSIKELSGTVSIAYGLNFNVAGLLDEIDIPHSDESMFTMNDVDPESDDVGYWGVIDPPSRWTLIEASVTHENLFFLEIENDDYEGHGIASYVERLSLGNIPARAGEYAVNYGVRKLVGGVVPYGYEQQIQMQVGVQEVEGAEIVWTPPIVLAGTYRADFVEPPTGRLISFRFSNVPGVPLSLARFDYDVSLLGEF